MKNEIWKKLLIAIVIVFFVVPSLSPAQKISEKNIEADDVKTYEEEIFSELSDEEEYVNPYEVTYSAHFSIDDLTFDTVMGYDIVRLIDGDYLNDIGKPMLPSKHIKLAVSSGMKVTGVRIGNTESEIIDGEYNIFPAQPPQTTNNLGKRMEAIKSNIKKLINSIKPTVSPVTTIDFIEPDIDTYTSSQLYPSIHAEFVHQSDLAGQGMAEIIIYPVQYLSVDKTLRFFSSIDIVVEGVGGYVCGDYLNSESKRTKYESRVKELVVNPEDVHVELAAHNTPQPITLTGGPYEHVIISRSADITYWEQLAEWHMKRGLRDKVVTTDWIYSTYSGSDNQERIRNFIIDAHQGGWETDYVLICGENGDVPFEYRTYEDDSIPSDQYYGDYDDDWNYEVYVGRSTARGSTEINRFIDKVLKYEQDPPLTDYILDTTLLGMDLTTVAVDGDLTRGEYLKEYIDTNYIPGRFTVTEVYDTDSSSHRTDFINALNDGQNLVNHNDHSGPTAMGTGDRNHGSYIYRSDVDALSNNNRMSNIFSTGCHPNEMDYSDCIAEYFVIRNSLQAGVSFTGNTRSGWFYVGDPYSLSNELDRDWWRGLFQYDSDSDKYILGETLAYTKDINPTTGIWRYCQWTLNLLGEPAMPIWTDTPEDFVVEHSSAIDQGTYPFTVWVNETGGGGVNQAYVCLYKDDDDEVYETGYTNSNGEITLYPSPTTGGPMYVTVTKHNYIPYTEFAMVDYHGSPYEASNPDPGRYTINIDLDADLYWDGGDPNSGEEVWYDIYFGTSNPPPYVTQIGPYPWDQTRISWDPGTMDVWTDYYWNITADDDDPQSEPSIGSIWEFHTEDNILPEWQNQGQNKSVVEEGGSVKLYAQGKDNIALNWAWLATNETGEWETYRGGEWWNNDWDYCKEITFDPALITDDITNFPVLISHTSSDFIGKAQTDGDDFVFIDATNTTVYNHEIEYYNSGTGELVAWVNITSLNSTEDTTLWVYYGNPDCTSQENVEGTWNSDFLMVHHMSGADYTELDDSTENGFDVTSVGGNPAYNQVGKVGRCVDFDGDDYLKAPGDLLETDSSYTAGAWVYVDGGSSSYRFVFEGDSDRVVSIVVWTDDKFRSYCYTSEGQPYCHSTTSTTSPQWIYVCTQADADNDQLDLFINSVGEDSTSFTGTVNDEDQGLNIGAGKDESMEMNGKIDEIRISDVVRSEDWIKTEYNNMAFQSDFVTVGSEHERSEEKYGSPMDLGSTVDTWTWSNFTWQNVNISEGTVVGWRLYYIDHSLNQVATDIMSFTIGTPPPEYTLTVNYDGNGYVTKDPDYPTYPEDTPVELEAFADSGWTFDHWSGHLSGSDNPDTIIMDGDKVVTAHFVETGFLLDGNCVYEGGGAVNPVTVEVTNRDTDARWQADTTGDYYSLQLTPGVNINATETLRIIAKDDTHYIGVTDYVVTSGDISSGGVTVNMTLDLYYLDLVDFPMYLADDNDPTYTPNQLCGPAAIQMNIDYMRWNSTLDPDGAPTWCENNSHNQSNLFNTYAVGTYMNADEMDTALDALKGDHYNFGVYQKDNQIDILGDICYWIDYEPPHDPGYPDHVPGALPAYGNYSNWMSIRGIHTDADPYPAGGSFTVHGLWVNDPYPTGGIGENTYKMASDWLSTYYLALNVPGDPYNGKYVAVCEPPEDAVSDIELIETTQYWDMVFPDPQGGGGFLGQIFDNIIIYAATQGARDRVCPYDDQFEDIFDQSYPGRPMIVKNLLVGDEKHDFYIVPYNNEPTKFMKKGDHSQPDEEKTLVAVIVNAETGQFEEASWVDAPVKYPVISENEARQIVYEMLLDLGHNPDDLPTRAIKIDLVYRGGYSQFSPEWRATINVLGLVFYISSLTGTIIN